MVALLARPFGEAGKACYRYCHPFLWSKVSGRQQYLILAFGEGQTERKQRLDEVTN